MLEQLQAIHFRHEHIGEHDVNMSIGGLNFIPCLFAVSGCDNILVTNVVQHVNDHGERGKVVFDNEAGVIFMAQTVAFK